MSNFDGDHNSNSSQNNPDPNPETPNRGYVIPSDSDPGARGRASIAPPEGVIVGDEAVDILMDYTEELLANNGNNIFLPGIREFAPETGGGAVNPINENNRSGGNRGGGFKGKTVKVKVEPTFADVPDLEDISPVVKISPSL